MNIEDWAYLQAYPVTVENAEEWVAAMAELLAAEYQGQHRDPYDS